MGRRKVHRVRREKRVFVARGEDVEGRELERDEFTHIDGEGGERTKDSPLHSAQVD